MKLKQRPEDFQVEELTDVTPSAEGPFALYRLTKTGWTTPDALNAIRRRWKLDFDRVSYGGLKDRHAETMQYLTIFRGPKRGLQHHTVHLDYLGQTAEPYRSEHIRANRFRITLRSLLPEAVSVALPALDEVRAGGLPNYFDDQRFGSVSGGSEFVAHALVQGRFEDALRLALTTPYEFDRPPQKKEKAILRASWGDWAALREKLLRSHARSLVDYLSHHPDDLRGAVERLRPELRGLYLSAYQSHLWNRILARWLSERLRPEQLLSVRQRTGAVPMFHRLDPPQRDELAALALPLPSARERLADDDPRRPLVDAVLAEEGLKLEDMKVRGSRSLFFSRGERPALCVPANLSHKVGIDEVNAGKQALVLTFELPRGSYATLVVKRVTAR